MMTFAVSMASPSTVRSKGRGEKSAASSVPKLDAGAKTFGLLLHAGHQFIAIHALGKAGEIFDDAGGGQQPAGLRAGEDQRLQIGARRIKRGRPARRTRYR